MLNNCIKIIIQRHNRPVDKIIVTVTWQICCTDSAQFEGIPSTTKQYGNKLDKIQDFREQF